MSVVHCSLARDGAITVHEPGFILGLAEFMSNAKEHTYVTAQLTLAELEAAREVEVQKREKTRAKHLRHVDRIKELDVLIEKAKLPKEPAEGGRVIIHRRNHPPVLAARLIGGKWHVHELRRRYTWEQLMAWANSYAPFTVQRIVVVEDVV